MKIANDFKNDIKMATQNHMIIASIVISIIVGTILCFLRALVSLDIGNMVMSLCAGPLLGIFIFPIVLSGFELYTLCKITGKKSLYETGRGLDIGTLLLGIFYTICYLTDFKNAVLSRDWQIELVNSQVHAPIYTKAIPIICVIALLAFVGYLVISFVPLGKLPPLAAVLCISSMYLGIIESILWCVQTFTGTTGLDFYLLLLPWNCIVITTKTVLYKMKEWKRIFNETETSEDKFLVRMCKELLVKAELWPWLAIIFMWPLLGMVLGSAILSGQSPSLLIKAWTETSDWNLSQRVSPPNVVYSDGHYLCTVAAGGHKKIVKPLRKGVRHGHEVIVNRQLCVANAFEQILEEKTPRFHKAVRYMYDTYGFPIAKLIHSPYSADFIYILMKPLEWLFLAVLYLVDVHPEDRIAVQYTGKTLKDFR